ncbi:GIN domain-containing protein [Algoriphagus marincola]|jgi:hypothetical protein|uniref:GIN domain-containing protein n=1 Tax=Algoriphagus marincola TaxID=264027 RepID=UPI0004137698|nr:DUF2807 domain-containing protein [Algoriphagus marincola]
MNSLRYFSPFCVFILLSCSISTKNDLGDLLTETQDISGIDQINLKGAFNIQIQQGDEEVMEIEVREKTRKDLKISKEGNLLQIAYNNDEGVDYKKGITPEITLTISDLKKLSFDGAGNIQSREKLELNELTIEGNGAVNLELEFDAVKMTIAMDMVGNTRLAGNVEDGKINFEGLGNLDASDLIVTNLDLQSNGLGRIAVHCIGELSLQVDGLGVVSYQGNPTIIKEQINGLGIVNRN